MKKYLLPIVFLLLLLEAIGYGWVYPDTFSQLLPSLTHFVTGGPVDWSVLLHGIVWGMAFILGIGRGMVRKTAKAAPSSPPIIEPLRFDSTHPQTPEHETEPAEEPMIPSSTLVFIELINRTLC